MAHPRNLIRFPQFSIIFSTSQLPVDTSPIFLYRQRESRYFRLMPENVLTIREVADLLKINEKTVYRLAADAKIPGFKIGGSWRFDRATIAKWLEEGSVASASPTPNPAQPTGRPKAETPVRATLASG